MKKTILLTVMVAALFIGCSKDDDKKTEPTYMRVLSLSTSTSGDTVTYGVQYGTNIQTDVVYTEISQEVYNYYSDLCEKSPNPRWRGEISE